MLAEEIKQVVSIEQVLSRMYGLEVKSRMPCPIHNGTDNNFSIKEHSYHCFSCGASGDIFNLVQELSNTDFKEALRLICESFGLDVGNKSKEEKRALKRKLEALKKEQEARQELKRLRKLQEIRICQVLREIRTPDGDSFLEKYLEDLLVVYENKEDFYIKYDIEALLGAILTKQKADLGGNNTMKIIIDSREQMPYQFTKSQYEQVTTEQGTLTTGDYSLAKLENIVAIERKSLDDLAGTLTSGRDRFIKECERGKGLEYFGLVIEGSLEDIKQHQYKSKMTPHSLLQSLASFSVKYGLHIHYCGSRDGGEYMTYSLLEKFLVSKQKQLEAILKHEPKTAPESIGA